MIDALWAHVAWRHAINGADAQWRSGEPALAGALPTVANLQWQIVAIDDFDGDGRADLFWRNATDGRNVIWRRANATMGQRVASVPDLGWRVLGTGDFDGDGRADVLWGQTNHPPAIWPAADAALAYRIPELDFVAIADVNGNGRDDVIGRSPFFFPDSVFFYYWNGANATYRTSLGAVNLYVLANWVVQGTGDFNGDGRDDFFVRNVADGRNVLWRGGNVNQQVSLATIGDLAWNVVGTGDYDGDGRADLFWRHRVTGEVVMWPHASRGSARLLARVSMSWVVVP